MGILGRSHRGMGTPYKPRVSGTGQPSLLPSRFVHHSVARTIYRSDEMPRELELPNLPIPKHPFLDPASAEMRSTVGLLIVQNYTGSRITQQAGRPLSLRLVSRIQQGTTNPTATPRSPTKPWRKARKECPRSLLELATSISEAEPWISRS